MNRIAGIVVLVIGVLLLIWGLNASEAFSSGISKVFTGSPTNKAIYLMVGGAILIAAGAGLTWYPARGRS